MLSSEEQARILYEVAMSIGTSLDLSTMLRRSISTILRKFNCRVGSVHFREESSDGLWRFKNVFSLPRNAEGLPDLQAALSHVPTDVAKSRLSDFADSLPLTGETGEERYFFILDLPGLGILVLLKNGDDIDPLIIKSLQPLLAKLSSACNACLQNEEIIQHRNNLQELVEEKSGELIAANRRLQSEVEERTQAEEALKESESRYRELVQDSNSIILRWTPDGRIAFLNKFALKFFGFTEEEVLGKHVVGAIVPETESTGRDLRPLMEDIARHPRQYQDNVNENMCKDGRRVWIAWTNKVLFDADGNPTGALSIGTDITERKRAEEERRQFEQQMQQIQKLESLGVMAGGIAHDFNNILFTILGNADIALSGMSPEAVGRDCLQEIQTAARRASALTDQMLAYSGKGALALKKLDLSGLVRGMTHLVEVSHSRRAIVKYRLGEGLSAIEGDPSQLRQLVMNLVTNASEALGEEGGIVTVTTGVTEATKEDLASTYANDELPAGPYVCLEVTDTGCGMAEEVQRRLFEPFFTTKFTGRGLGMAAVLGVVRAHKGAIAVQSEVDHGTTVRVLFPALDEQATPPHEEAPREDDWTGHGTVLVVDDEDQVRNVLKLVLERKGFAVLTAEDGLQATEVFREHKDGIRCVLLDLTMPHMGGEETFVQLHQIRNDVPVLLVSGYGEEQLEQRAEDLGFAGFLKKPVHIRDLLDKVHEIITDGKTE